MHINESYPRNGSENFQGEVWILGGKRKVFEVFKRNVGFLDYRKNGEIFKGFFLDGLVGLCSAVVIIWLALIP